MTQDTEIRVYRVPLWAALLAVVGMLLVCAAAHGQAEMLLLFRETGMFSPGESALPPPRVLQQAVTPPPVYLIELADYGEPTRFELWATPLNGSGQRRKISQPTSGQGWDVATGFVVIGSDRTWRVVYELDQIAYGVHDLYAVDVDGARRSLVYRLVLPGYVRFGPDEVTFAAEVVAGGAASWWISDTVGAEREVLFADGFESGGKSRWQ